MQARLPFLLVALVVVGCANEVSLFVDLKTDFVGGAELTRVEVFLDGEPVAESSIAGGDDLVGGHRIAELDAIEAGGHELRVALRGEPDVTLAERRFIIELRADTVLTALVTRDCRDVSCGPSETCAAGQCVAATCLESGDPTCPEPECMADADCPAPMGNCATAACVDGGCLDVGSCAADQYCDPELGCRIVPGATPTALDCEPATPVSPTVYGNTVIEPSLRADGLMVIGRGGGFFHASERASLGDPFGEWAPTTVVDSNTQDHTFAIYEGAEIAFAARDDGMGTSRRLLRCDAPFQLADCTDVVVRDELGVEMTDDLDGPSLAANTGGEPLLAFSRDRDIYVARPATPTLTEWNAEQVVLPDLIWDDPAIAPDGSMILFHSDEVIHVAFWQESSGTFGPSSPVEGLTGGSVEIGVDSEGFELFFITNVRGIVEPLRARCRFSSP